MIIKRRKNKNKKIQHAKIISALITKEKLNNFIISYKYRFVQKIEL